jgi:hypothetical protein
MSCGIAARMPRTSMPPSPGNCRSSRAVWMMPAIVGGTSFAASQTCTKRNHSRGSAASSVDARVGAAEVEHVDEHSRVAAVHGPHDPGRLRQVACLGPVRELEAHEDAERLGKSHSRAKRSVARSRSGIGNCAMIVARAELDCGLELRMNASGSCPDPCGRARCRARRLPVAASRAFVSSSAPVARPGRTGLRPGVTRVMRKPT